jgi:hypothetical protein
VRMKKVRKTSRTKRAVRPLRSKKTATAPATERVRWMTSAHAIVLAMMVVVVTAALLTAREDVPPPALEPMELTAMSNTVENKIPRAVQARSVEMTKPAAVNKTPAPMTTPEPTAAPEPSAAPVPLTASTTLAVEPQAESKAATTITGCLENDEGTFQLTDASGADAPTARSWRSGFLKKRSAHVELVDTFGLNLRQYIGRRVAVTGTLVERDMRARSVRLVGACE